MKRPPVEHVDHVDEAIGRLLGACTTDGSQPMLCTHRKALGHPSLRILARSVRRVTMRTYSDAYWWRGGPVLGIDLTEDDLVVVRADPRVTFVVTSHSDISRRDECEAEQ